MKMIVLAVAAATLGLGTDVAASQQPDAGAAMPAARAQIKVGAMLKSSDGKRLGRIDEIDMANGVPQTIELFTGNGVRYVPVATISAGEGKIFTTSMTYSAVMDH